MRHGQPSINTTRSPPGTSRAGFAAFRPSMNSKPSPMPDDERGKPFAAPVDEIEELGDEELEKLIEDKLTNSMGAPGSQIALDRMRNLDAYLAEPTGDWSPPDIEDRSDIVATDAADTVEWMLPSLLRVFASGKDAIDVTPRRPQHEANAKLVRAYLHWLWWDKLDGLTLLHSWLKDGLTSKVGFVRVDYVKASVPMREPYEGLTEAQVQGLLADEGVTLVGVAERTETTPQGPVQVYDIELERAEQDGHPGVQPVPPEEMRIDNGARYGEEPAFIAQEYRRRRSELLAEGFDVDGLTDADDTSKNNQEAVARRSINSRSMFADDDSDDPELRVVDAYLRRGSAQAPVWIAVLMIAGKLMKRDRVEDHPFGWWCPSPMPHVFFGHCPVDQAIQPQRLRTRLLRAVEDNVYLTVNGRTGVVGGDANTIDDILDSRPGGIVRLKTKDDLVPIVQPDLSGAAWTAVEWAEQWNEKRTGFSRLSKGLSSEAINDTATGVMEITDRADMRTELVARHAAAALSKVLAKMLRVAGRHQDVSQMIQVAGQWVEIDPRDWGTQYQVRVKVGLGSGNKDRQSAQLTQLAGLQQSLGQAGMVPPPAAIALARKLCQSMGFDNAEQFFPDPPPPNPNQQPPLPLLIEQMKGQQRQQETQLQAQTKLQEVQANLELQASNDARDAERAQMQAALNAQLQAADQENKRFIAELNAANDRYRTELQEQTRLQIAAMQAQSAEAARAPQIDLSGLQRMEQAMQGLHEAIKAPKRVLRDPVSGRVSGIEPVQQQLPINGAHQ